MVIPPVQVHQNSFKIGTPYGPYFHTQQHRVIRGVGFSVGSDPVSRPLGIVKQIGMWYATSQVTFE
jgi:hypothetical protein